MSQSNDVAAENGLYLPDEPTNLYDLGLLPDPPGAWEHLGHSFQEMQKTYFTTLKILRVLARAHLWGFRYHDERPVNGQIIQISLWKLFYYQRDECRPKNWSDLFNWERDTGPRLLRYDLNPHPDPISRFYPCLPIIGLGIRSQTILYQYPQDAPDDIPGEIMEQFLFGLRGVGTVLSSGVNMHGGIHKSDRTCVYAKAPEGLSHPENVSREDVARGIVALGMVGESDIETVQSHSSNGWMARLRSKELAWAIRSNRIEICGITTHATLCNPEGARIFLCEDYGWATSWGYLILGLLQMQEIRGLQTRFWVGARNTSYTGGHRALLVFESPVALSDFEVLISGPSPCLARFEGGRESDSTSMTKLLTEQCSMCFQSHPERPIQHCPELNTLYIDAIEGSEWLLPTPPAYFYFR